MSYFAFLALALVGGNPQESRPAAPRPQVAEGWRIDLVAQAPQIAYPTAVVAAPDGTVFVGQDPMDMPGPTTRPIDSVVALRGNRVQVFAEGLWAVMGLEWADNTLFVVHAPFLSAFQDTNGDGKADRRVDLITGLGPEKPGAAGLNDHIASGIRLGMDGFLYIAVGDKGIPKGVGRDGAAIQLRGGGVIRIRPDGTGLEVVSTGERNPLAMMLSPHDEIFTYGNDDDSKRWPNSLTHHIVGGHYGYPFEFLADPTRCLPILGGPVGGAGAQGLYYAEAGLPARYRDSLFLCDWGRQEVVCYAVKAAGASFQATRAEPIVTKGDLPAFRPFSLAVAPGGSSFYLTDWAFDGWRADGPRTGRLFRVSYAGEDRPKPPALGKAGEMAGLDHPAHAARLETQRVLASRGPEVAPALIARLHQPGDSPGRRHALWALDTIGGQEARAAIRAALADPEPTLRLQAARSVGIRREQAAAGDVIPLLQDPQPAVRREAAIALGRLRAPEATRPLMASLGDGDPTVSWSIRAAIRQADAWEEDALIAAIGDNDRREAALRLTDRAFALPAVRALVEALAQIDDPAVRRRIVANLAGQYRAEAPWSGEWFGPNALAAVPPRKSEVWDRKAMLLIVSGLTAALADADPTVRREAIVALGSTGAAAAEPLRNRLQEEPEPATRVVLIRALAQLRDMGSVPLWSRLFLDENQPKEVRIALAEALETMPVPDSLRARFQAMFDPKSPAYLVAAVLPGLARSGSLPPNDLKGFFEHPDPAVRAAAIGALTTRGNLPPPIAEAVTSHLKEADGEVRRAAITTTARFGVRAALPGLIDAAKHPATRAEATRALATMPDPRALDIYIAGLDDLDAEVRGASESALRTLRDRIEPELERRLGAARSPIARAALERVLARYRPVVAWNLVGPFPATASVPVFRQAALDLKGPISGRRWEPRKGDPATGRVLLEDLKPVPAIEAEGEAPIQDDPSTLAAYAVADIASAGDRRAELLVGSSGALVLECNGRIVLDRPMANGRPYAPDSDRIEVELKAGKNRLVLRTRPGIGPWTFSVQVAEPGKSRGNPAARSTPEALRSFALGPNGDAAKGRELFAGPGGLGCARCHDASGKVSATGGPDLSRIGQVYDRAELIRSVLEPSARIAPGYRPRLVARRDGQVVSGRVLGEGPAELVVADPEGRPVRIPKADILDQRDGDSSPMPDGLVEALNPAQFADLIAYLESLKASP